MSFNYQKNKAHSEDSFWTSYSDLFLGLSTIFLLLYVTASLRSGTEGLRTEIENKKLATKVEEMEQQLRMYESVKNDYIQNQASKSEAQEYEELMDKLTLLQEDAKSEKDRLVQEAMENENKVKALNKYQQMVRNVINSNKMAKSKIINRDDLIKEQDVEMEVKDTTITELNKDIQDKKQLIAQGEQKIQQTEQQLDKRMGELRQAYKANKISKKLFEQRMGQARADSAQKVQELNQINAQYEGQLQQANTQLSQAQTQLAATQGQLSSTQGQLSNTQGQLSSAKGQLSATQGKLSATQGQLSATQGMLAKKEGEIEGLYGSLEATRNTASARAAALQGEIDAERAAGAKRASQLQGEIAAARAAGDKRAASMQAGFDQERARGNARVAALSGELSATQGELAQARAEIEARKSVAGEIQKGFAKAGIKADIDLQTGDVVLDFGQAYFDSDSDRLKKEMKGVLEKAMPIYSKSLFGNPKVSDKVSAVEIIGFASPTYQGRFVDPHSNRPEDKAALKYNMDLSYRRANSIFSYMLDDKNINFEHQRDLLALMKVSGRSFLEVMKVQNRNVASAADFCRQNDCKKAQRVIIRFNMDQKK